MMEKPASLEKKPASKSSLQQVSDHVKIKSKTPSLQSTELKSKSSSLRSINSLTSSQRSSIKSLPSLKIEKPVIPLRKLEPLRTQPIKRKSLTDYHRNELKEKMLFSSILTDYGATDHTCKVDKSIPEEEQSILVTGFGMRNLKSFQDALLRDKERKEREQLERLKRQAELYRINLAQIEEEDQTSFSIQTHFSEESDKYVSTFTETSDLTPKSSITSQQKLKYLLDFKEGEEDYESVKAPLEAEEKDLITGTTASMRQAQKYLRTHRIFELFQFLITHLLSAAPENPIDFLLELFNKCLLYRSGMGKAPLLYDKRHLEQLFYRMDRMRTGFIEPEQYKTGMKTLGICSYNQNPTLSDDGMVSKETFIEEAHDCQLELFDDLIRRRMSEKKNLPIINPPPTEVDSSNFTCSTASEPYFIPPDLLKPTVHPALLKPPAINDLTYLYSLEVSNDECK